ncbi:MAG: GFA family protein [Betaproteobacteria bacterium]|nr:GFA family protein [Betaproteobacteria bacterium]
MSEKTRCGHCLCGAVQVSAVLANHEAGACHCKMCQRWAGGPVVVIACTPETVFEGQDAIAVYPSSAWAERAFCKHCGSPLFYRMKNDGSYYLSVGLLDDTEGLKLVNEIFIDRKPSFYSFAEKTNQMTEAQVMAMYNTPPGES